MPENDILEVDMGYVSDSKITNFDFHSYIPYTKAFNNNDEIRICVQQTDVYPYLHESFLYIEGDIEDKDKVKLGNNGLSFLFEQVRLELNGIEIDSSRMLGITSSIKGYLSSTPDNYYCYENAGWTFKNSSSISDTNGHFTACIPLKYWLGFFEHYRKFLLNSRIELILTRSNSDLNALIKKSDDATTGSVNIKNIVWKVPHVSVDDSQRLKLMKIVEKEKHLFIPFRSFETYTYPELGDTKNVLWNLKTSTKLEKPRYIIVGLQKNRNNSITADKSEFDHSKLKNIKVFLNSNVYPYDNLNLDFTHNDFTLLYNMYTSFQESYYENGLRNPILSPKLFLSNAPIIVLDVSKQNDSEISSTIDLRLEIEADDNLTGVSAYCMLIHDRIVEYSPFTREVRKLV
ncbi:uncharacterized protein LOC126835125 [Adelges cooleyi]|uniref:uncharacterized protein LOC126835125 n=1 Tax=Adelges cooleyi TaxID=133065 RepID=UPI00217FB963|nr:uncharacterized protein LOC126835125 [Adelges cooleyi]